jgi:alpha-glucosidase
VKVALNGGVIFTDSVGTIYSDIGDGYEAFRLDKFSLQWIADGLGFGWESEGEFAFPYSSIQMQVHCMKMRQAWVDEVEIAVQENSVELSDRFSLLHLR